MVGTGGVVRPIRRVSILADVQDHATAQLAGLNGAAMKMSNSFEAGAAGANQMKRALIGWAAVAGASALAMGALVNVGSNLDRTFSIIEESSNATNEQMQNIIGTTREIAAEMPVMMSDVSKAFEEFTYAGFSAQEAVDASQSAVEMAVAGQMSMADAVRTTASVINAFNLEAEQAGYVSSALSATFANSAITIDEIGSSLQYASAQMSSLGFAASDTAAAIGTMADSGMRGTMAGTALNQAFSQIISGTGRASDALEAAGLSIGEFTDEEGNMKSMVEVIGTLRERSENLTDAQMTEWLEDLAGRRGQRALKPLIEDFDEFESKVRTNALAAIKDFTTEMDEAEQARIALTMDGADPEAVRERFEEMEPDEFMDWAESRNVDLSAYEDGMAVIEDLRAQSDELSDAEMSDRLQTMFEMEESPANELAAMINDQETSLEELSEAYDEATTSGELSAAQMDTLGGKFTYLRGSIQSAAYAMYRGFEPALSGVLDLLVDLLDLVNRNEMALRWLGRGFFAVSVAASIKLSVILSLWAAQAGLTQAIWGSVTATFAYGKALHVVNPALLVQIVRTRSLTPLKLALGAAMASSRTAAIQEARMLLLNGQIKAGLTKLTWGLVVATKAYLLALSPLTIALWGFIAVVALVVAYKQNWLGIADLLQPAVEQLGHVVSYLQEQVSRLVSWFDNLTIITKVLFALLLAFVSPWLAVAAVVYLVGREIANFLGITYELSDAVDSAGGVLAFLKDVLYEVGMALFTAARGFAMWGRWLVELIALFGKLITFLDGFIKLVWQEVVGTFEAMTEEIDSAHDALDLFWKFLRDLVFSPHDLDIELGINFPDLGIRQWFEDRLAELEQMPEEMEDRLEGAIGEGLYDFLDRLDNVIFGWARGQEERQEAVDDMVGVADSLRDFRQAMEDAFEGTVGEDLYNFLERLDNIIFGWARGQEERQEAMDDLTSFFSDLRELDKELADDLFGWIPTPDEAIEMISGALEAIVGYIEDFKLPNIDWTSVVPGWLQDWLNIGPGDGDGSDGSGDGSDDSSSGSNDSGGDDSGDSSGTSRPSRGPGSGTSSADPRNPNPVSAQRPQTGSQVQLMAANPAGAGAGGNQRGVAYTDDRTVDVSQDPTINIEVSGSNLDAGRIQSEIERAMDSARHRTLEDLIDWLTLGGPEALEGGIGGEPSDPQPDDGEEGEEGEEGEGGEEPENDTGEEDVEETEGEPTDGQTEPEPGDEIV